MTYLGRWFFALVTVTVVYKVVRVVRIADRHIRVTFQGHRVVVRIAVCEKLTVRIAVFVRFKVTIFDDSEMDVKSDLNYRMIKHVVSTNSRV